MRSFMLNLCAAGLVLAGCGDDTNTSVSDTNTSTGPGPVGSSSSESGEPPVTTGDSEAGVTTTTGVSDSDSASTTLLPGTSTGPDDTGSDTGQVTTTGLTTGDLSSTGPDDTGSTGPIDASTGSTGDETTAEVPINNCEDFKDVFSAEVLEIRSCTSDDECGMELKGTSCGCTMNWVARKDADLTEFNDLVDLAGQLGCELPFFSTCACPPADGFACHNSGVCTWNYL